MTHPRIFSARRTAVVPRDGAFRTLEAHELMAPVLRALLDDAGLPLSRVDDVIMGNALYGGGNPARVGALAAGLPETVSALTIDTQCCGGLDAIALAAARIRAGDADIIIAGGVESYSRSPLRLRRPKLADEAAEAYLRPPFTPWAQRDPDMIEAAATLAAERHITRQAQEAYAIASHTKAFGREFAGEIVEINGVTRDAFTRRLSAALAGRIPPLVDGLNAPTAATTAVEADACAAVLVVSPRVAAELRPRASISILGAQRLGSDPEQPALAPIPAAQKLLQRCGVAASDLARVELMEAFAVQALVFIQALGLQESQVNVKGGALARGHPIGASGAVLITRLWHELIASGGTGLAAIAGAGGLGSAMLLQKEAHA